MRPYYYPPSVLLTYVLQELSRLQWSDSFYHQVRAIEALSAILASMGEGVARRILEEAVKFEPEAIYLDSVLWESIREIREGNMVDLPEEDRERLLRLRKALEEFKAKILVELDSKMKSKIPVIRVGEE